MAPTADSASKSDTDYNPDALVEKIKASTSETREELEVRELHEDDVLHFVIKKENLRQRIKRKLTGKSEGKDNETIRASKELLNKGVWAEIETETNHVWARLKTDEDGKIIIRVASQKSTNEEDLLGVSEKKMWDDAPTEVFLPSMVMSFADKGKKGWNIKATSKGSILTRAAEGLVGLWQDERLENREFFTVFDQRGVQAAEADGGREIKDMRNIDQRPYVPCDFYRMGEEPFVCFNVEEMGYTDGK